MSTTVVEYPTGYEYPSGPMPTDLTWDEFLALPYELRNASLVDGDVFVNPPNAQHEFVVKNLLFAFEQWKRAGTDRGEASTQQSVKINDRNGYQPDVLWFAQEHCAPPGESRSFSGPPSIVIEIFSRSTRRKDEVRKRRDYEKVGVPEVWFVDPRPGHYAVTICRRPAAGEPFVEILLGLDDHIASPLLEGFNLPVSELFGV